jgi:orotidine-5'-phosphate decarboxylase
LVSHFADRLEDAVTRCGNPVLVGLDPHIEQLPPSLKCDNTRSIDSVASAIRQFCFEVIDVVAPLVPAVKPQAAFFERWGPAGMQALADVIAHAHARGLLVILDGKRNDIGSTAKAYAEAYLGPESPWQADALTVNPYLGDDSLAPFVDVAHERRAGVFVLVKTSNPGGRMFQDLECAGRPVFEHVARHLEAMAARTQGAAGYGTVGAVVAATYPAQLYDLRQQMPHTWFLVPGFGSQGGTAADVLCALDSRGLGAVINSSRSIIFAHQRVEYSRFGNRWQSAVEAATRDMIAQLRVDRVES